MAKLKIIILIILVTITIPSSAQDIDWEWNDLANHAGLAGLKSRDRDRFEVDVIRDIGSIMMVAARVQLFSEEVALLTDPKKHHFLSRWRTDAVAPNYFKQTVEFFYSEGELDVSNVRPESRNVAMVNDDPPFKRLRLYFLLDEKDGKTWLYYFFRSNILPK